jgi:hypothetical protein
VTAKLEVAKKALDAVVKARFCFALHACCASPLWHSIMAHDLISASEHVLCAFSTATKHCAGGTRCSRTSASRSRRAAPLCPRGAIAAATTAPRRRAPRSKPRCSKAWRKAAARGLRSHSHRRRRSFAV